MIRFAPQDAKQTVAPQAKAQPAAASGLVPAANVEPLAGLLPDLEEGATPSKTSKPRAAKKPKTAAANAAVQLDLDA